MTRQHWRTKLTLNPKYLRGGHPGYPVASKRRVSPPLLPRGVLTFRPSFPNQMTYKTGKRPTGAAAAILAVYGPRGIRNDSFEGIS